MPPRVRTLLILAIVTVAGVTALALLAQRYRGMVPEKSVMDLQAEPSAPARHAESVPPQIEAPPALAEPESEASKASPPEAAEAPVPGQADRDAVEVFLNVRSALHRLIAHREFAAKVVEAELVNEQTEFGKVPMNIQFFGAYRATRGNALENGEMTPEEYEHVREAFAAWMAGKPAGTLGAAFAEREDESRKASLEGLEPLDYKLEF